jgi:hypothetical protein
VGRHPVYRVFNHHKHGAIILFLPSKTTVLPRKLEFNKGYSLMVIIRVFNEHKRGDTRGYIYIYDPESMVWEQSATGEVIFHHL